ncbi:AMED_5909 family protein [Actinosynnema sp. NPDC020468]|uniref:AMED_5909 family protein n=1 Tax=Actinosynnema sp. NPDC020468 TaxID=3154488 RepID=UPI0033CE6E39
MEGTMTGADRGALVRAWNALNQALTLQEARDALERLQPRPDAGAELWIGYHVRAAKVYRRVARTDRYHHHEALAFAQVEENSAEKLKPQ